MLLGSRRHGDALVAGDVHLHNGQDLSAWLPLSEGAARCDASQRGERLR